MLMRLGRRLGAAGCLAAALALPPAVTVLAAESTEHQGGGMPQLDFTTAPSQIFWLIVTFVALYWLLSRKALPRVAEILETRQERIAADLDRAAQLRAEAEQAIERYEQLVAQSREQANAEIEAAREKAQAEIAERQAELDKSLGARIRKSERQIGKARETAMGELADISAEIARLAVARLTDIRVSEREAKVAVDRVMEAG